MSHNVHFIRVYARNGEAACLEVEQEIEGWGNDANYFSVVRAISAKGEVFVNDDSQGDYEYASYKNIENVILSESPGLLDNKLEVKKFMAQFIRGEKLHFTDWSSIQQYAERAQDANELEGFRLDKFNAFREEYYDNVGLTNMFKDKYLPLDYDWIVAINMHS